MKQRHLSPSWRASCGYSWVFITEAEIRIGKSRISPESCCLFFFLLRVLSSKMGKELQYHSTSNWENYKVQLMLWNSHVGGKKFTAQIFILLSFIFFFLSHRYIDANSCKLDISLIACKLLTPWGTVEPPLWLQQSSKQVRNFLFVAVSSIEELKNNTGERGKRQGTCDAFHLHSSHCIIYTNLKNLNK